MSHGIVRRRSMAFSSLHRPAVACASWPSHSHSDTSSRQTLGRRTISTLHPLVLRRLRRSFVLDYSSFSWHWNLSALAATHASIQGPLEAPRPWRQYWQCCQIQDENSRHFWQGPLLRDLDELEPFCRIFRVAEQVHNAVMEAFGFFSQEKSVPLSKLNGQILNGQNGKDAVADLFLVEDKVVSALGLICASLHQQKEEVLEGRLRFGTSVPDSLQPFSQFRAEMHRYCKELEATLCGCFSFEQFKFLHRKLQNLVCVCLDAGYPRTDDEPSHADIPNWGAVHLHLPYYDGRLENGISGLVLWKGGRIIEEGSQWLIDKGFKAIVDLRAEVGVDEHLHSLMNIEVFPGSIAQIWLPFNQGSCPSKDDIAEFGKLIADPQNHPLYFHGPEGLGQTFSLLSRLRDIISTKAFENSAMITGKPSLESSVPLKEKQIQENSFIANDISMGEHQSKRIGISIKDLISYGLGEFVDFLSSKNPSSSPFEVQRPVSRSLFRHGMSMFMKEGQVASSQSCWKLAKTEVLDFPGNFEVTSMLTNPTLEHSGRCGLEGFGIPRAGGRDDLASGNGHLDMTCGKVGGELKSLLDVNGSSDRSKGSLLRVAQLERAEEEKADEAVVGNMCASTTGVVRLQSRKKAEIYLVRADGFTCTREQVKESTLAFTHPSTQQQMVMWKTTPRTVLLLKKPGNELMQAAQQVASFLHYGEGMNVIVEPEVHDHFARIPGFGFIQTYYNQDASNLHERVDFVVCLGGDGVILHASNLFRNAVPPVVSFNLGSLGFLTAHLFKDFMQDLGAIIHGNTRAEGVYITLRMRLRCELFQNGKPVPGKIFEVLNEVVLDRGSSPYLCKIECYERNRLITKVQADGVIIATPTGSTAYSSSAGGSMVHPNVPCMLFTPICPHSLSFRPVILPDSALLELKVPEDARSNVWVSFDGKKRQQLSRGHSVRICMSEHPLPTVNKSDQTDDWFRSLVRCLYWNERLEQKHL